MYILVLRLDIRILLPPKYFQIVSFRKYRIRSFFIRIRSTINRKSSTQPAFFRHSHFASFQSVALVYNDKDILDCDDRN